MMNIEKVLAELTNLQAEISRPLPVLGTAEEYEPYKIRRQAIKDRIGELRQMVDLYDDSLHGEPEPEIQRMLTLPEAAEKSNLPYNYLRLACKQGKIPYIMSGRKYYISQKKLGEFLNNGACCCEGV